MHAELCASGRTEAMTDDLRSVVTTVSDAVEHIGFGRFQYRLMVVCGMIWMADSMEMMLVR